MHVCNNIMHCCLLYHSIGVAHLTVFCSMFLEIILFFDEPSSIERFQVLAIVFTSILPIKPSKLISEFLLLLP